MVIGLPKETTSGERRVGLTPDGVNDLIARGHSVIVQTDAGAGSGFLDERYLAAGAEIAPDAAEVYSRSRLIVKVKEPQSGEVSLLNESHILFAYLHLAANLELARNLLATGATCVAYETVEDERGRLPLLTPMSEIAGRVAIQEGARALEAIAGGRGVLMSGVPGVGPATVLIVGGGTVGLNAALVALGMGADVTIADLNINRLRELDLLLGRRCKTQHASSLSLETFLPNADLVVGAALVPGARAPSLVYRHQLAEMRRGAVLADVAIDQGGCFETSRPTSHAAPTFVADGVVHYCVANIPAAVPVTATRALSQAIFRSVLKLADEALQAFREGPLKSGLNIAAGQITRESVAEALDLNYVTPQLVFQGVA